MNRLSNLAAAGMLLAAQQAATAADMALPRFEQIELRGGGEVRLRQGPVQQVTISRGSSSISRLVVEKDRQGRGRLVIDACQSRCPANYELQVEIVTPLLNGAAVEGGGSIRAAGPLETNGSLALAVDGGGEIDARAAKAASVTAAVNGGGSILARPEASLTAAVNGGGEILYWGSPAVVQQVSGGGEISRAGE